MLPAYKVLVFYNSFNRIVYLSDLRFAKELLSELCEHLFEWFKTQYMSKQLLDGGKFRAASIQETSK